MTDRHSLRDKIARALFDQGSARAKQRASDAAWILVCDSTDEDSTWHRAADAVLAVIDLDKVKAEAQVYALRETSDALAGAEPSHLGDATEGLEFFDYGTAAEYGIDVAAAYLRDVANETAREAGIETVALQRKEQDDD